MVENDGWLQEMKGASEKSTTTEGREGTEETPKPDIFLREKLSYRWWRMTAGFRK
jgi:hypothetical protein